MMQVEQLKQPVPPPPQVNCTVCGRPVQFVLHDDWRSIADGKVGFSSTFMARALYRRIEHEECQRRHQEESEKARIEWERQEQERNRESHERMAKENLDRWYRNPHLPHDAQSKTFDSFQVSPENAKTVRLVRAWKSGDDFGFLLMGPAGTGKSHLGLALVNSHAQYLTQQSIAESGGRFYSQAVLPAYWPVSELLAKIRSEKFEIPDHLVMNPRLLFLDDLGAENITDWSREIFFRIFDHRLNQRLPTIVTTNFSLNELKDRLHERIISRILGLCVPLVLSGLDRRRDALAERVDLLAKRGGKE